MLRLATMMGEEPLADVVMRVRMTADTVEEAILLALMRDHGHHYRDGYKVCRTCTRRRDLVLAVLESFKEDG